MHSLSEKKYVKIRLAYCFVKVRVNWSEDAQSCPTLCDPMDSSLPGSSSMGFSRQEYWSGLPFLFQRIFLTQGSNPGLPHCRQTLYRLNHQGKPKSEWMCIYINLLLLFSHLVMSDSLWSYGLQHTRPPCPSPSPGACSNSCPLSQWCHPTISPSFVLFCSCLQSFPASGLFPMNWLFKSGGQSIEASVSASVLPVNIQGWFPLGLTGLISFLSKGLSSVFSSTTVQKHYIN